MWDLKQLKDNNIIFPNTPGQLSKFFDFQVPERQFFALDPSRPFYMRLGCYEVIAVAGSGTAGGDVVVTLHAPLAKPPEAWGTVPMDYIVKAYADTDADGVYETKLTVKSVDYNTNQVTVTVTWASTTTYNVRFGYAFSSGYLYFTRELPARSPVYTSKKFLELTPSYLNTLDHFKNPIKLPAPYFLVEHCHLCGYIYIPLGAGNTPIYLDIDPDLGVTQIGIEYILTDLDQANNEYRRRMQLRGLGALLQRFPDLYHVLVGQLAGYIPESLPEAIVAGIE